jgi:hypothetical protein
MVKRILGIFTLASTLALTLSACANNQPGRGELLSSNSDIDGKDDAICRKYGARPGEPAYIQCRVAQDQRRDAYKKD